MHVTPRRAAMWPLPKLLCLEFTSLWQKMLLNTREWRTTGVCITRVGCSLHLSGEKRNPCTFLTDWVYLVVSAPEICLPAVSLFFLWVTTLPRHCYLLLRPHCHMDIVLSKIAESEHDRVTVVVSGSCCHLYLLWASWSKPSSTAPLAFTFPLELQSQL